MGVWSASRFAELKSPAPARSPILKISFGAFGRAVPRRKPSRFQLEAHLIGINPLPALMFGLRGAKLMKGRAERRAHLLLRCGSRLESTRVHWGAST